MTGKTSVWPVKPTITPEIVRWPAVILSPADMLRFLSPVSTVSTRNTWNHDSPFGVHTHEINEKKNKRLQF